MTPVHNVSTVIFIRDITPFSRIRLLISFTKKMSFNRMKEVRYLFAD